MAKTIIEESGGRIELDSELGKGTEFRLYLPADPDAGKDPTRETPDTATARPIRATRSGTLLVVDDEAPVRSIAAQMLKYLGYTVIEASDGLEAIAALTQATTPIDAILLDVYMPKLSGRETYRTIREQGLNVPVIVCSGFSVEPAEFTALAPHTRNNPVQVIQKPYSMENLARVVSRAVNPTPTAPPAPAEEILAA